jgi:hypothetical protein
MKARATPTSYAKSILYITDDSTVAALVKREFGTHWPKDKVAKLRAVQSVPRWRSI